jgi:AcrR family transcriptional regulator
MDTVNIEDSYHHGNLKHALIQAGLNLLAESGVEGLSLRKMARIVGVSHNAPYMHFADKEAVLAAIAQQGFQLLGEALETSQQQFAQESSQARLRAAAHSYIHFALNHPNHLMVMFGKLALSEYPELRESSHTTFQKLVQIMQAGQHSGTLKDPPAEQLALLFWANLHGLGALLIAQKIPDYARQGLSDEDLTTFSIEMLCRGILQPDA